MPIQTSALSGILNVKNNPGISMNFAPLHKIRNSVIYIKRHGVVRSFRHLHYRLTNYYYEQRLSVNTRDIVKLKNLGLDYADSGDYVPMGYMALYSILRKVPLEKSESVFLDYGAGKGRAIVVAATYPFKKVIGVELSEKLIEIARRNVRMMRSKKACCIELYNLDATGYHIPDDVNIIYFFNPFKGEILGKVVKKIYESYNKFPRKILIIYFNNDHFDKVIENDKWLRKTYQSSYYPDYSCGIYESETQAL